jgi:hypothetical protein
VQRCRDREARNDVPNTLGHIGAQMLASRPFVRADQLRWVLVGCVLPDVPWILQRAVRTLVPAADPFELRAYVVTQGSLAMTLLLCAAVAAISRRPWPVFGILSLNAAFHLGLDALQSHWGSGVHLMSPFHWAPLSLGVFWPEGLASGVLTVVGLLAAGFVFQRRPASPADSLNLRAGAVGLGVAFALAYVAMPWALRDGVVRDDSHSLAVLRMDAPRAGRTVELERNRFVRDASGAYVLAWTRERLDVVSGGPDRTGTVTLRGRFDERGDLAIEAWHLHRPHTRELFTYLGLSLVVVGWLPRRGKGRD